MGKKKQFVILAILITILVFSISASCSFCGISINTDDENGQVTGDTDNQQTEQEEDKENIEDDIESAGNGEESQDNEIDEEESSGGSPEAEEDTGEEDLEGQAPEIVTIFYDGSDITEMLQRESLPIRYEEGTHEFIVIAEDTPGDELNFEITVTHGEILGTSRAANDSIAFTWLSPENAEDSVTPLDVEIIVTVEDTVENRDTFVIGLALLPVEG